MRNIISSITDESTKDFLEYLKYERRVSVNTVDSYGENLLLLKNYTNKDLISLKKEDIKDFLDNVEATARTKAHYLTVFNSFYKYLVFMDKIKSNPCDGIKAPKLEKKLPTYLTNEEIAKLFNIRLTKPVDYRNKAILEVMYATGARISEVINLKWSDIDLNKKFYNLHYYQTKTRKNQQYYLEDFQIAALQKLKELNINTTYVFENNKTKKPITYTSFFRIHNKLRSDLNMPDLNIHAIRHLVAFLIVNNGYSLEITAKVLGHQSISSTSRYAVLEMKQAKNAYNKVFTKIIKTQ